MRRRDWLGAILALGVVAYSRAVPGQARKTSKLFRVGIATDFDSPEMRRRFPGFLRELGWTEGRDFTLSETGLRYGSPPDQVAAAVLALAPDIVVVVNTAYTLAVHQRTKTIPIVMWAVGYPVEAGLAESLARPGKNVTGNSLYAGTGVWGKLVQLLRDAKPDVRRVAVLWGYVPPMHPLEEIEPCFREIRLAGRTLGMQVHIEEIARAEQLQSALSAIAGSRPDALLVTSGPALWTTRPAILKYAAEKRWPTIADFAQPPDNVADRPLLTYAPSWDDLLRQTAGYVGRILAGAKAADLPIQQPAKFELEVNLKAARVIGLSIPESLLLRADRVIE